MKREKIVSVLARTEPARGLTVCGWIRTRRDGKDVSFLEINDGSSLKNLQIVVDPGAVGQDLLRRLTTGASVRAVGDLVPSLGAGQRLELRTREVELLGAADPESYPLQKKRHGFEFLRTIAHLRPRTNTFGAVMRVRGELSFAVHEFFQSRGFVPMHTPIITASDCEGAGEMFTVTSLPPDRLAGPDPFAEDFFGKRAYLTVSGQLNAEAAATALAEVYTFGPTFRAENSNTARHLAEFWMIEPEMAFCDIHDDMDLAEAFMKHLVARVLERCADDLAFLDQWVDKTLLATLRNTLESDFVRLDYTEAVEILKRSGRAFEFPVEWGHDLQSEHERHLTEQHFGRPVILTAYPKEIKSFYMRVNDDGRTVAAMDVLVPRIGEIIGGSQREERYDVLTARMAELGLPLEPYSWYLDLLRFGSVPHAGFGMGFERMVMFATGMTNIRDVIPFPRYPGHAEF
ncbi:asparagine--tRNA ligase [Myxococcota bacterium]|nr:asparagine--tRNA ligase [Myxococcota bacterium]